MVYYFSGTGNSLDAARRLTGAEEEMIDMASLAGEDAVVPELAEGEAVGLVFPVYYGGLPSLVKEFAQKLRFKTPPAYVYAVITCGAKIYGAGAMLRKALAGSGAELKAVFPLVMPDNYVIMYKLDSEDERAAQLTRAREEVRTIARRVEAREITPVDGTAAERAMTAVMYPLYGRARRTKKFWVDDQCIGCAACVKRCPVQAMAMQNGRPAWVKDRCVHCMSCVRCGAIQYGKSTVGRGRYTNPVLKNCH